MQWRSRRRDWHRRGIESPSSFIQLDSARNPGSIDRALNGAFTGMMDWLTKDRGMDTNEAYLHSTA